MGIALTPGDATLHFRPSEVLAHQRRLRQPFEAAQRRTELAPDNEFFTDTLPVCGSASGNLEKPQANSHWQAAIAG